VASPVWVSANSLAGGNANTAAFTLPSSLGAGDIVVAHFYRETNFSAVTAPDGTWTREATVATGVNIHEEQIWWKRCVGGESGTVTFTWTGTAAFRAGGIHRITGAKTIGDPFADFTTNFNDTASFTTPAVSLTGTPPNSLLLWGASNFNGSSTWTRPAGYAAGSSTVVDVGASKDNTAGGNTGSVTGSSNQSDTMTAFLGVLSERESVSAADPLDTFLPGATLFDANSAGGEPLGSLYVPTPLQYNDPVTGSFSGDSSLTVTEATTADGRTEGTSSLTETATITSAGQAQGTSSLTATATITASGQVTGTATLTETATITPAGRTEGSVSLTETATITTAARAEGTTSLTETATITAVGGLAGNFSGTASLTVSDSITASGQAQGSTSLTETATVTSSGRAEGSASRTVTATITASGEVRSTSSLTETATITPTGAGQGTATRSTTATVTPSGRGESTASLTETVTITAAGQLTVVGQATRTTTVTITVSGQASGAGITPTRPARVSTGTQHSRSATGTQHSRSSPASHQHARASTGTQHSRVATSNQHSRVSTSLGFTSNNTYSDGY
jgi:hypothetical protein